MAKGRQHINDDGNITQCSVTVGTCPFEARGHYDTREEAEAAYADQQEHGPVGSSFRRARSPKTAGFSLEEGGYYGEMKPRSIQIDALNETANALLEDGNTQLVAACGTGKSYMGRQLMRRMMDEEDANGVAIVLTSSRKLAVDTAADLRPDANGEYDRAIGDYGKDYEVEVIEIHSDSKDGIKVDGAVSPERIAERWKAALDEGKRVVIVSTYQSSDKVQQVQALIGERAEADLLMNDEAHNILGQKKSVSSDENAENSGYRSFVNEIPGAIQAKHRLYATATPPLADSPDDDETSAKGETREEQIEALQAQVAKMSTNGKERLTVYSDDEKILGRVSGAITQQAAISEGYLTKPEYQLRSAVVRGQATDANGFVDAGGNYTTAPTDPQGPRTLTAQTYSAVSATLQAMTADPVRDEDGKLRNPVHNALAYTGSIDQARAFRDNFREVAIEQSGRMDLETATANQNASDPELRRRARLRLIAEHGEAVAAYSGETREAKDGRAKAFSMFKGRDYTEQDAQGGWSPHKKVLANVDIFSEGISINEIDTVVISDQSKTSERAMTQAIGRSLRTVGGNTQKNTGHVIIPQVVSEDGKELNGGFITAASYGATRVERAVSTRKLKGEAVPADETTTVAHYDATGKLVDRKLAADISRTHVDSSAKLLAAQAIERADQAIRSATGLGKAEADRYKKASKLEQAAMQKSFIAKRADEGRDPSWGVAHDALQSVPSSDMATVRQAGRVVTAALSARDFSAVPTSVTDGLSRAGIIRRAGGIGDGPTKAERRELALSASQAMAGAFVLQGGQEEHPDIHAVLSQGVSTKEAVFYMNTGGKRGSKADYDRLVNNYESLVGRSDDAMERIYGAIENSKSATKVPSASLAGILSQRAGATGPAKAEVFDRLSALQETAAQRASEAAASGSAGYELDSSMVSRNGTLKVPAQKKLAELI